MKKILIPISILLIAAACNQQAKVKIDQNQQAVSQDETANWKIDSENTVSVFIKNVNTPGYGDNVNVAFAQLSTGAQSVVKSKSSDSTTKGLSLGLSSFLKIQEAPDKGTSITGSEKLSDGTVKVSTSWNYSGMTRPVIKIFVLVLENGKWKIDKVQSQTSEEYDTTTSVQNWKTYSNAEYKISFKYPTDWQTDSATSNSVVAFKTNNENLYSGLPPYLKLTVENTQFKTVDAYISSNKEDLCLNEISIRVTEVAGYRAIIYPACVNWEITSWIANGKLYSFYQMSIKNSVIADLISTFKYNN